MVMPEPPPTDGVAEWPAEIPQPQPTNSAAQWPVETPEPQPTNSAAELPVEAPEPLLTDGAAELPTEASQLPPNDVATQSSMAVQGPTRDGVAESPHPAAAACGSDRGRISPC